MDTSGGTTRAHRRVGRFQAYLPARARPCASGEPLGEPPTPNAAEKFRGAGRLWTVFSMQKKSRKKYSVKKIRLSSLFVHRSTHCTDRHESRFCDTELTGTLRRALCTCYSDVVATTAASVCVVCVVFDIVVCGCACMCVCTRCASFCHHLQEESGHDFKPFLVFFTVERVESEKEGGEGEGEGEGEAGWRWWCGGGGWVEGSGGGGGWW